MSSSTLNGIEPSGRLIENAKLKEELPVNAYIEPDLDELIHLLEAIPPKVVQLGPACRLDWDQVCERLNAVFRTKRVQDIARNGALAEAF
jgi:hypothetical protein